MIGKVKTLRWENHNSKWWVVTQCQCGKVSKNKKADLIKQIDNPNFACRSCTMVRRNRENADNQEWLSARQRGLEQMFKVNQKRERITQSVKIIRDTMSGARQRCTNPNDIAYKNYGGRGIEFRFTSIKHATDWIINNIGYRPSKEHSIDRIDVNGHYEAGNLRWATRTEQANNKRAYKRGAVGERIRQIQIKRPDLCYETIRYAIKQGYSNEQIINKPRNSHYASL